MLSITVLFILQTIVTPLSGSLWQASPGTVLILQLAPLATVFRAIRQEVRLPFLP